MSIVFKLTESDALFNKVDRENTVSNTRVKSNNFSWIPHLELIEAVGVELDKVVILIPMTMIDEYVMFNIQPVNTWYFNYSSVNTTN